MKKLGKETVEVDVLEDIICNGCGETCKDHMDMNFECATVTAHWGYCSPWDTEAHEAHLCVKCYKNLLETLKLEPTIVGGLL